MLFSDIARGSKESRLYAEPQYDYLDRSGRSEAGVIRSTIEEWFGHYPDAARADLGARFQSSNDIQHTSAAFELYLYELFRRFGYQIQLHPQSTSGKSTRPDFLLNLDSEHRAYVEAVQSNDASDDDQAAQARLNVVYDAINRIEVYGWYLGVHCSTFPDTSPSARKLRGQLKGWLNGLNPDQVLALAQIEREGAYPVMKYTDGDWEIEFTAFPRPPEKRNQPVSAVLGVLSGEPQWLNTWEGLRDSLIFKGGRYGELDGPMIIALNAHVLHLDEIDVMQALFG